LYQPTSQLDTTGISQVESLRCYLRNAFQAFANGAIHRYLVDTVTNHDRVTLQWGVIYTSRAISVREVSILCNPEGVFEFSDRNFMETCYLPNTGIEELLLTWLRPRTWYYHRLLHDDSIKMALVDGISSLLAYLNDTHTAVRLDYEPSSRVVTIELKNKQDSETKLVSFDLGDHRGNKTTLYQVEKITTTTRKQLYEVFAEDRFDAYRKVLKEENPTPVGESSSEDTEWDVRW